MTGSRLLRLYGNAVYPNNPRKLPKSKIQSSLKRLEGRRLIEIGNSESSVEFWLITNKGKSPVLIREKGPRKLSEIPVTEVIANLQIELGDEYENLSTDSRFNTLISIYGIKQAEFHILGEVLTNEWQELLS
jgi:hypothetical protein